LNFLQYCFQEFVKNHTREKNEIDFLKQIDSRMIEPENKSSARQFKSPSNLNSQPIN